MKSVVNYDEYVKALRKQGVKPYNALPPLHRLLLKWGFSITPPLNQKPAKIFWFNTIGIGILLPPVTQLVYQAISSEPANQSMLYYLCTPVLAGFFTTLYMNWKQKKLDIPEWPPKND